jgi:lambda family phage minor tail protein L
MNSVSVAVSSSTAPSDVTATFDGVAMTQLEINTQAAGGGSRTTSVVFVMDDVDLPVSPTSYDIVVTVDGGGTVNGMAGYAETFQHVVQLADATPAGGFASTSSGTLVTSPLDAPALSWNSILLVAQDTGSWSAHNNGQIEVFDDDYPTGAEVQNIAVTSTVYDSSTATDFTNTFSILSRLGATQCIFLEKTPPVGLAALTTVVSIVTTALNIPREHSTTIAATSATTIALQRDRGYVTSLATTSALTTNLDRLVDFDSASAVVSAVTVQPIMRTAGMAALVSSIATASGLFGATRPLASVTAAQLVVTPQFGSDFDENKSSLTPGCYVELFEVDTTVIGGAEIFRFISGGYEATNVNWQGEEFIRFPIEVDGFEWNATSQAPPQPTLRLSNVNSFVLAAVITLGDLVGAKVTRWRTYEQFLDDSETPDPNAHFPPDTFFVQQKTAHNKFVMEWTLSSALDLPGIRLPRRQVLRDQTSGNLYAPGVSQTRFRGR